MCMYVCNTHETHTSSSFLHTPFLKTLRNYVVADDVVVVVDDDDDEHTRRHHHHHLHHHHHYNR